MDLRDHESTRVCSAVFPDCGFGGLSSPPFHRATGKSPEPAGWKTCATFGFMERSDLQHWTRIGTMNPWAEVAGRVTACAPSFALREAVVAGVGAQRTARPTFRFRKSSCLATLGHAPKS